MNLYYINVSVVSLQVDLESFPMYNNVNLLRV